MSIRTKIDRQLRRYEKPFETFNEITLSKSALLYNFDFFASMTKSGFIIPVLKSNAYGHGIAEITDILKARTFPYIAVDGFYESIAIHDISKQSVLVMGAIKPDNFKNMSFKGVAFAVHDIATLQTLGNTRRRVKVHIELETGMTRHGVSSKDLPAFTKTLKQYPSIIVEGVMTHLADADNPSDESYNQKQASLFDEGVEYILEAGFKPKYLHIAQSAGSTKVVSKYANTMRIGIALYGINPLEQTDNKYMQLEDLQPVLSLTSTITKVVNVEANTTVSYGRTYKAKQATRIGVLPLGYFEGLPRSLSNVGAVQYKNEYLPIAGRVCMNHTMIELGVSKASVGDKVIVISRDKKSQVALDTICRNYGIFNYEFLVRLNQSIRRRIVD